MMSHLLTKKCPRCAAILELCIDDSEGPPDEVGTECDCGAIPVWRVNYWIEYELGGIVRDEGPPRGKATIRDDYELPERHCAGCGVPLKPVAYWEGAHWLMMWICENDCYESSETLMPSSHWPFREKVAGPNDFMRAGFEVQT